MTLRFQIGQTVRKEKVVQSLAFGQARLSIHQNGRCRVEGGSRTDRLEVIEWISLCAPHLVLDPGSNPSRCHGDSNRNGLRKT